MCSQGGEGGSRSSAVDWSVPSLFQVLCLYVAFGVDPFGVDHDHRLHHLVTSRVPISLFASCAGLSPDAVPLLSRYVTCTGDIQTASLLLAYFAHTSNEQDDGEPFFLSYVLSVIQTASLRHILQTFRTSRMIVSRFTCLMPWLETEAEPLPLPHSACTFSLPKKMMVILYIQRETLSVHITFRERPYQCT